MKPYFEVRREGPGGWRQEAMTVVLYLGAIVAANLSVAAFGPGISVLNAFLFIGLDLTARDSLDDHWHDRRRMLALISAGGVISFLLNRDAVVIAVASTVAFTAAAAADWIAYRALVDHPRWVRVSGSNVVGAAIDSVLFPTIAFGGLMPWVTIGQFAAKVAGGALWYGVFRALSVRSRPR